MFKNYAIVYKFFSHSIINILYFISKTIAEFIFDTILSIITNRCITIYTINLIKRNIDLRLFNIISYINIVTKVIGIKSISLTTGSNLL